MFAARSGSRTAASTSSTDLSGGLKNSTGERMLVIRHVCLVATASDCLHTLINNKIEAPMLNGVDL